MLDIFIEKCKTHDSKNNLTPPFSCQRLNTDCNITWVKTQIVKTIEIKVMYIRYLMK